MEEHNPSARLTTGHLRGCTRVSLLAAPPLLCSPPLLPPQPPRQISLRGKAGAHASLLAPTYLSPGEVVCTAQVVRAPSDGDVVAALSCALSDFRGGKARVLREERAAKRAIMSECHGNSQPVIEENHGATVASARESPRRSRERLGCGFLSAGPPLRSQSGFPVSRSRSWAKKRSLVGTRCVRAEVERARGLLLSGS